MKGEYIRCCFCFCAKFCGERCRSVGCFCFLHQVTLHIPQLTNKDHMLRLHYTAYYADIGQQELVVWGGYFVWACGPFVDDV